MKTPTINSRVVKLEVLKGTATRTSVNAVESRTTSLESDVATAQSDISTLQGNVATLTQGIVDAVSTHNTAPDAHADLRTALAGKQDSLTISPVGTALLNLSTPAAAQIPRINADASVTLIDAPSNVEEVDANFVSITYNPGGGGSGGWLGNYATFAALRATSPAPGSLATVSSIGGAVLLAIGSPTTAAAAWVSLAYSYVGVLSTIRHPDGRYVLADLTLSTSGTPGRFLFSARSDVYNASGGYEALLLEGSTATAVRHYSSICRLNSFSSNNLDFAWKPVSNGAGAWYVQNPYQSGATWLGVYGSNQLGIATEANRVAWIIEEA